MKRRWVAILLAAGLVLTGITGCGKKSEQKTEEKKSEEQSNVLRVLNGKAEVNDQLQELAKTYQQQTGVEVQIESPATGVDSQATLKGYYLSDQMPDILVCEGASFENWEGLLVDLSDQDWTSKTNAAYKDDQYGVLGFPYTTEAIGLIYNADILQKAGVDPTGLTSPEAYKAAFDTLNEKKDELGLTAIVGMAANAENIGWSTGNHMFGAYLDSGLAMDDTTYFDQLQDGGKLDDSRIHHYTEFVQMLIKNADKKLLTEGTYDDQVKNFASGKYAFVTQGSWIGSLLVGDDAAEYQSAGSFPVGMAPYAFEDGMDTILASSPSWWAVCKEGNVEEAKKFLSWCATADGQQILVEKAGFISPFTDCSYVATDPFAGVVADYIANGKTSNWHWQSMKDGMGANAIAPVFESLAKGDLSEEEFINTLQQQIAEYLKK